MRLPELQRACLARFASMRPASLTPELEDLLQDTTAAAAQVAVYRNNVTEIAAGALRTVFPTVEQLVGTPCFRSLARRYSQVHASRSGDLQSYGRAFPALLEQIYSHGEYAWLSDVAQLEFALDECLTEQSLPGISAAVLQAALAEDDADLRLTPNPSLHLVESRFPILAIWRAHRTDDLETLSLDAPAQNVVIVRAGKHAQMTAVSDAGAQLIRALAEQASIGSAIDRIGGINAEQLGQALRELVLSGAFTEVAY